MPTNTVRLHRILRAPPERVYRAFLSADAMAKWIPPNGFTGTVHHMEAKVGGTFRMSFTNFTTQQSHAFGGEYLELVPNERIRYTDKFDDPNLPGVIHVTVSIKAVSCGSDLTVVQEGIPDVNPSKCVTSAGKTRSFCWENWLNLKFGSDQRGAAIQHFAKAETRIVAPL